MAHLGQDLSGALQARDRLLAIANDPDLDDQGKLFAFCLLAFLNERRRAGLGTSGWQREVPSGCTRVIRFTTSHSGRSGWSTA